MEHDLAERGEPPELSDDEVLAWADAHHERTGEWPIWRSGPIPESPGETWLAIEAAFTFGLRGLPSGATIPRFLAVHRGRYNPQDRRFSVAEILAWADAWHRRTGEWPTSYDGEIPGGGGITWNVVDTALRKGQHGLDAGSSLSRLLTAERGVIPVISRLALTEEQVLAWADAWHERTGSWPTRTSGEVPGLGGVSWRTIDAALRDGRGGLAGGSSLARLLARERGAPNIHDLPPLKVAQVLNWAGEYQRRTGCWPKRDSGPIGAAAPGETWREVDTALRRGTRGFRGGSSLPHLLAERRGVRSKGHVLPLRVQRILAWADAYYARHGEWPTPQSGPIEEAPGETWGAVHSALYDGHRGLPGGSSLARLFAERRGIRNSHNLPPLTIPQLLAWADAHHERTGQWPKAGSGPIAEAPGETWDGVHRALYKGYRGLPGGSSLPRLLARERGVPNEKDLPRFRVPEVLQWADAYYRRHGTWPAISSGPIPESAGETWRQVNEALYKGQRGLRGGSSLARLLARRRGVRNPQDLPPLAEEQILAWADAHRARTGRWPTTKSGPIPEAPGEKWQGVENALRLGLRGLPGGSSLARLIARARGGCHPAAGCNEDADRGRGGG
jgi:hypothetical protein